MIFSLMLISGLVDLPLSLYAPVRHRGRHGFNRMTSACSSPTCQADAARRAHRRPGAPRRAVADGRRWADFWWLYVWLFWCGFNLLDDVRLSDLDRRCSTSSRRSTTRR